LHGSQKKISGEGETKLREKYPSLSGGAFFSIDCKRNYELIRELSSFGQNLLVLSPKEIQDEIIKEISQMFEKYSKLKD
jgi:predicted DNA-binding transcriptional regulator YafY